MGAALRARTSPLDAADAPHAAAVGAPYLSKWILDPVVTYPDGKGSLFAAREDSDVDACAAKPKELKALA